MEWIHDDQSRDLGELRESKALSEGYAELLASKSKKRKRVSNIQSPGDTQLASGPATTGLSPLTVEPADEPAEANAGHTSASDESLGGLALDAIATNVPQPAAAGSGEPQSSRAGPASAESSTAADPSASALTLSSGDVGPWEPQYHFYLLKPHTISSRRVLVPLPPSQSLSECLKDQVVLEFPTIQVLPQPPSSLPEGFMLEAAYLHQSGREAAELDGLLATVAAPTEYGEYDGGAAGAAGGDEKRALDDRKILEVLQRDLGGET